MSDRIAMLKIPAKDLRVHPLAQRELVPVQLARMKVLDLDAIGTLHAVKYIIGDTDAYWVVDGQHRLHRLMEEGLGDWVVDVALHLSKCNDAGAADLFLKLNNRAAVTIWASYQQKMLRGDTDVQTMTNIVTECGYRLSATAADGAIMALAAVTKVYNWDGTGDLLRTTLQVLTSAFGRVSEAVEGPLLVGLAGLLREFGPAVDLPTLVAKLSKQGGPIRLKQRGIGIRDMMRMSTSGAIGEAIRQEYNAHKTTKRLEREAA